MSNQDEPVAAAPENAPGLGPPAIDHDRRYVLGFPLHVAITVCVNHSGTYLRWLPLPSWAGNTGAIGVRLSRADTGQQMVNVEPNPVVNPEFGTPIFTLRPGACRRMLIDLSSYLPAGLASGDHLLAVSYVASHDRAESRPVPVELSAPGPEERKELDRLTPALVHSGSWGRWTSLPPQPGDPVTGPVDARDPARFNKVLRYLMYGPEELSAVDPALIDVLHGVYEPEAHALRAELSAARGDVASLGEQAEIIRTRYPELLWWLNRIQEGRSEIAFVRSCRGRVCEARP